MRRLLASLLASYLAIFLAAPAYAEDAEIALPKGHVAALLAKSAELDARLAEIAALQAVIVAQQRQLDAQAALIKTQDELLERQAKLTALADEESKVFEGRAERVEKQACSEIRKARALGYAATGASIGGVAFPPFGIAIGGAAGAILGFVLPCP